MLVDHGCGHVTLLTSHPFLRYMVRKRLAGKRMPALVRATVPDASSLQYAGEPAADARCVPRLTTGSIPEKEADLFLLDGDIVSLSNLNHPEMRRVFAGLPMDTVGIK